MDDETQRLSTDDKYQTPISDNSNHGNKVHVEVVQHSSTGGVQEEYTLNSVIQDEDPLSTTSSPDTPSPDSSMEQSWKWDVDGAEVEFTPQHFYQLHADRFNDQDTDSFIGQGSFGSVFKYYCSITGKTIAIKQITINNQSPKLISKIDKSFRREVDNHKILDHVNVLKFIDSIQFKDVLAIVVEYAEQGSLDAMMERDMFCRDHIISHTQQILTGLHYLHNSRIVHKDLRCDNILMNGEGVIKLADFGISKPLGELMSSFSKSLVGNLYWSAPEQKVRLQAAGTERSVRSQTAKDIWSLGVVLLEMFYYGKRRVPYMKKYKANEYILKLNEGYCPKIPTTAPAELRQILQRCFIYRYNERPTATELLIDIQDMVEEAGAPDILTTLGLGELTPAELENEATQDSEPAIETVDTDYLDKIPEQRTTGHLKPPAARSGLSHSSYNLVQIREDATSDVGNQTSSISVLDLVCDGVLNLGERTKEDLIQIILKQNEQVRSLKNELENVRSNIINLQSEYIAELKNNKN